MLSDSEEKKFLGINHETLKAIAKYGLIAIGLLGLISLL